VTPTPRLPRTSRRQFLRLSTTLAAGVYAAPALLRGQNLNDKLNIAFIGSGGKGGDNMNGLKAENVVALCDVDAKTLGKAAEKNPDTAPPMFAIGVLYAQAGDKDRAFEYFEKSLEQREPDILRLQDPNLGSIRSDPRFKDIVRRVGLPQ